MPQAVLSLATSPEMGIRHHILRLRRQGQPFVVDGEQSIVGGGFEFVELPKGRMRFINITSKGGTTNFPGTVRWDGKYVAVGDLQILINSRATSRLFTRPRVRAEGL